MRGDPGGSPPSWWPEWAGNVVTGVILLMVVSMFVYVPLMLVLGVGLFAFVLVLMGVEAVRHLRGKPY